MKNKKMAIPENASIWKSEVRGYEIDIQGIVNNANYFHYFDHARVLYLLSKGVDWADWHRNGFNIVLIHSDFSIKSSLIENDAFYVTSEVAREGKLRIRFNQQIYRESDHKLIAEAINTVVCVSLQTNKPVMPTELASRLFG